MPDTDFWAFENIALARGFCRIAGTDEVGRGPLAGPVVSAAVMLSPDFSVPGVRDSKMLSPARRQFFYDRIYDEAVSVGLGIIDAHEIDRVNIFRASQLAMIMAVENLMPAPDFLLVDGKFSLPFAIAQQAVVGGDDRSISIAAASIVAKVTRDRLMERYDRQYPAYGFAGNKGYPTKAHRSAIKTHGCCFIHRKTFKGVKEFAGCNPGNEIARKCVEQSLPFFDR
jgi:ribonuclease HII